MWNGKQKKGISVLRKVKELAQRQLVVELVGPQENMDEPDRKTGTEEKPPASALSGPFL
ncbi:hypothetical protein MASR2M17_15760 [Aminivibrio sp.]